MMPRSNTSINLGGINEAGHLPRSWFIFQLGKKKKKIFQHCFILRDRIKVRRAIPFIYKDKSYEIGLNWQLLDINHHRKCLLFQI